MLFLGGSSKTIDALTLDAQATVGAADSTDDVKGVVVPTAIVRAKPKFSPKQLFKRYGLTYVLVSLSMSACSMLGFYVLCRRGVDAAALLGMVGIRLGGATGQASTLGLAYLLHKAASPIRFPPTIALTAIVPRRFGGRRAEPESHMGEEASDAPAAADDAVEQGDATSDLQAETQVEQAAV